MEHLFTRKSANATSRREASIVFLIDHRVNGSQTSMKEADVPKVGMTYRSQRTGRPLVVTAIENDRIYYQVEGFSTMAPLFLSVDKFSHLVGLDKKSE